MYTTLNKIRSHLPCEKGWKTLLKSLGKTEADDEPLPCSKSWKVTACSMLCGVSEL